MTTAQQIIPGSYPTTHGPIWLVLREQPYTQDGVSSNIALYTGRGATEKTPSTLARLVITLDELLSLKGAFAIQPQNQPVSTAPGQAYSGWLLATTGNNLESALAFHRERLMQVATNVVDGKLTEDAEKQAQTFANRDQRGMNTGAGLYGLNWQIPRPFRLIERNNGAEILGNPIDISAIEGLHIAADTLLRLRYYKAQVAAGLPYSRVNVQTQSPYGMMVRPPRRGDTTLRILEAGESISGADAWKLSYVWKHTFKADGSEGLDVFRTNNVDDISQPTDHWQSLVLGLALVAMKVSSESPEAQRGVGYAVLPLDDLVHRIFGDSFAYTYHAVPTTPVNIRGSLVGSKMVLSDAVKNLAI